LPAGVHQLAIENFRGIGELRVAHPDPDRAVALDRREAAHGKAGLRRVAPRHAHAGARAVEGDAVIAADQHLAIDPSLGERHPAMRASIFECGDGAAFGSEQCYGFVQDGAAEGFLADFIAERRHVPVVAQKHDLVSRLETELSRRPPRPNYPDL